MLWVHVGFLAGVVVAVKTGSVVVGVLTLLGIVFAALVGLLFASR